MKLFALETDQGKIIERFCHDKDGERVVLVTYYHTLSFLFATLDEILVTVLLFAAGVAAWWFGLSMTWVIPILVIIWFIFVFLSFIKAYIDWQYDFILVTTDKIVLVDQTSIFRHQVKPIHIENIGSISTDTQFMSIFPFGILNIDLKEGAGGERIRLKYVPRVEEVASKVSQAVTHYQRYLESHVPQNHPTAVHAAPPAAQPIPPAAAPHQQPPSPPPPTQTL